MIHDASRRRVQSARSATIDGQRDGRDHQLEAGEEHPAPRTASSTSDARWFTAGVYPGAAGRPGQPRSRFSGRGTDRA